MDILGPNPSYLRIVTLCIHFVNGILLTYWILRVCERNMKSHKQKVLLCSTAVSVLFVVHPLNAEIIGWLSAQSYAPALSFTLLANIYLEIMIMKHFDPATSRYSVWLWQASSLLCYCLACLCKAPAVMLPATHCLRLLQLLLSAPTQQTQLLRPLALRHTLLMALCGVAMLCTVRAANAEGTFNATITFSSGTAMTIRATVTVWNFIMRIFLPSDLRAHYNVAEEEVYAWDGLWIQYSTTLFPCLAVLLLSLVVLAAHRSLPVTCFAYFSALACWIPCVGIVNHGWALLGADRYCYLPLAMLCPGAVELLMKIFVEEESPCQSTAPPTDLAKDDIGSSIEPLSDTRPPKQQHESSHHKKILGSRDNGRKGLRTATPQIQLLRAHPDKLQHKSDSSGTDAEAIGPISSLSTYTRHTCGIVFFLLCLTSFRHKFFYQLQTWRDDKQVLLNCIRHDPLDWECHQILSDWYGHHERDEVMAMHHLNITLALLPAAAPKAQLFKAKVLMELQRREEACDIYFTLFAAVEDQRIDKSVHPYIINNHVVCRAIRNGIDSQHLVFARQLLNRALNIARGTEGLPDYVLEGLETHADIVNNYQNGRPYEVTILY